ncbi:hypothetical protein GXW83_01855 [Streptacidiphilus sp. PB12-B1b]|uniref:hypothetical protein n=1 Tax=Streptacidiphilus sp. PB12-B1b TaxID=2705012 RepID=UPI0015F9DF0F|nr:hypothetical protein [Streptacidiphilus sp. PB12-B1b]QMU74710.1 hypothetical protein GXW83_01855 [Streptacidiphilus sp. PB12-B1b]
MATTRKQHKRQNPRPLTAKDILRAAAKLLPEGAATSGGITPQGVLAQFDVCVPDYLLDCLVELGRTNPVSASYWALLRQAAWLLPDVPAGAYHRLHAIPRPDAIRRDPLPGTSAQSLLLARRRSEGA